ncbi:peptidylprolyl isomerase, partial [Balamuthia mandrillaris]
MAFWGLELQPGEETTITLPHDLHLTQASLGEDQASGKTNKHNAAASKQRHVVTASLRNEEQPQQSEFVIANLRPELSEQATLNLFFPRDQPIAFRAKGFSSVHLLGVLKEGSSSASTPTPSTTTTAAASSNNNNSSKKTAATTNGAANNNKRKRSAAEVDQPQQQQQEAAATLEASSSQQPKKKKRNKKKNAAQQQQAATTETSKQKDTEAEEEQEKEEPKKTPTKSKAQTKTASSSNGKGEVDDPELKKVLQIPTKDQIKKSGNTKKMAGGLIYEDIVIGTGKQVQQGKRVSVHYKGYLTNGKSFDASGGNKPFIFRLGLVFSSF